MITYASLWVFIAAFGVSAFAGIGAFLKTSNGFSLVSGITAFLNSGILGLAAAFLCFSRLQDNIPMLLGISTFLGLLGASGQDLIITSGKKFLVSLISNWDKKDIPSPTKEDQNDKK